MANIFSKKRKKDDVFDKNSNRTFPFVAKADPRTSSAPKSKPYSTPNAKQHPLTKVTNEGDGFGSDTTASVGYDDDGRLTGAPRGNRYASKHASIGRIPTMMGNSQGRYPVMESDEAEQPVGTYDNESEDLEGGDNGSTENPSDAPDDGGGYEPNSFEDYYNRLIAALNSYGISLPLPTLDEIYDQLEAFLRPSVDAAIEDRRDYGETVMAELDADAYSRGMGGSSYLSSMKQREYDDIASDIASMESNYNARLAEYLYDASVELSKLQAQLASIRLQQSSGRVSGGASSPAANPPAVVDEGGGEGYGYYEMYLSYLSPQEQYSLFHSSDPYWRNVRNQMRGSMTREEYYMLYSMFNPSNGGGGSSGNIGGEGLSWAHVHW